jgi:hypothetical protein
MFYCFLLHKKLLVFYSYRNKICVSVEHFLEVLNGVPGSSQEAETCRRDKGVNVFLISKCVLYWLCGSV